MQGEIIPGNEVQCFQILKYSTSESPDQPVLTASLINVGVTSSQLHRLATMLANNDHICDKDIASATIQYTFPRSFHALSLAAPKIGFEQGFNYKNFNSNSIFNKKNWCFICCSFIFLSLKVI